MKLAYPAIFSKEEQSYIVEFPDLPGCITCGDTMAEAIFMAEDAASGWVLGELEDGRKVPAPSEVRDIKLEKEGDFVNLIALDMEAYAAKYGKKAVRKTLTIPAWLNTFAEDNEISCSAVLQEALIKMATVD